MFRSSVVAGLLAVFLISSGALIGDDKDTPKAKGTLPQNWGKLGLSDEQKQKVYSTQEEYRGKIGALEKQIRELKAQERADLEKVLTDAQKARLREILASKAPADTKDKKPDEKKEEKKEDKK